MIIQTMISIGLSGSEENGFEVAYSNQAFEFWFILHFNYHLGPMHRETYKERLDRYLGFEYDKTRATCKRLYDELLSRQQEAIRNAENVYLITLVTTQISHQR